MNKPSPNAAGDRPSPITILDGGTGRELKRIGAPFRQPEWSALALIEAPEYVAQVHEAFADAGADVITTNAYALVPFHIGEERFAADAANLATLAATIARQVGDERGVTVAGDLPPALGSYRPDDFDAEEAERILSVLIAAQAPYVDVWLSETLSSTDEAKVVVDALAARNNELPWWVSFTLADELDGDRATLRSGQSVTEAVRAALEWGAEMVSFNCSPPEVMDSAITEARAAAPDLPIGVYANAFDLDGAQHDEGAAANSAVHEMRADLGSSRYSEFAERWIAAGATAVGGCCGIGSDQIREVAQRLAST